MLAFGIAVIELSEFAALEILEFAVSFSFSAFVIR